MLWSGSSGQAKAVDLLVKGGANLKFHHRNGTGALQYTAQNWNYGLEMAKKLAGYGISVNDASPRVGFTPLMAAVSKQNWPVALCLIDWEAILTAMPDR